MYVLQAYSFLFFQQTSRNAENLYIFTVSYEKEASALSNPVSATTAAPTTLKHGEWMNVTVPC